MTKAVLFGAIAFGALQLRNVASGWQEPAAKAPAASPAPVEEAPEPNPEASALMRAARDRLANWKSIQANVVQRVDVGDRRFKATGRFLAGEFPRLRLEYEVTVGKTVGRLLEVCDGQVLHVERRIEEASPESPSADSDKKEGSNSASEAKVEGTRRDVQRILRATTDAEGMALSMQGADIGLGGISALLASLDRTMVFDSIREEQHEGQTFRVIQGIWKPGYLAELQKKLGNIGPQLAAFLPERVRIYFEAESLFPVRILYLKLASTERRTYRAMLSLEFHDVEFDAELPPETFTYRVPSGVTQKDDTDEFVQLLKASQGQAPMEEPGQADPGLNLKRSIDPTRR